MPAFAAAETVADLPANRFPAIAMLVTRGWHKIWPGKHPKRPARTGGPGGPPPDEPPDYNYWEDPTFWLWMIH